MEGSSETADNQIARKAELEQKYNMKLEFINTPWMEYLEKITASVRQGIPVPIMHSWNITGSGPRWLQMVSCRTWMI